MAYLRARLTEQSTHTSVALAAVLVLTARAAGIDLTELLTSATGLLTALASACAPQSGTQDQAVAFRNAVAASNFESASRIASSLAGPNDRRELLWSLNAGATALHQPDPTAATSFLDSAENNMTTVEGSNFNWNSTYRFGSYDAAMVNTYKAFAALSRGDRDGARVEINRAQERLQRIAERYRAEIAAARDNINSQPRPARATALLPWPRLLPASSRFPRRRTAIDRAGVAPISDRIAGVSA